MSFQFRHNDIWLAEFVKLCHVPLYTFLWCTLIEEWSTLIEDSVN